MPMLKEIIAAAEKVTVPASIVHDATIAAEGTAAGLQCADDTKKIQALQALVDIFNIIAGGYSPVLKTAANVFAKIIVCHRVAGMKIREHTVAVTTVILTAGMKQKNIKIEALLTDLNNLLYFSKFIEYIMTVPSLVIPGVDPLTSLVEGFTQWWKFKGAFSPHQAIKTAIITRHFGWPDPAKFDNGKVLNLRCLVISAVCPEMDPAEITKLYEAWKDMSFVEFCFMAKAMKALK